MLLLCLGFTAYFAYHAIYGRHGLEVRSALTERSALLEFEIKSLEAVRANLERDVALLTPDKPDPDIVHAALGRLNLPPSDAVLVGDTPYDIEAAAKAGVRSIALRSGGHWSDADFAGAVAVYDDPADLLRNLASSPVKS